MRMYLTFMIALSLLGCNKTPSFEEGMAFYTESKFAPATSALTPYADRGDYRAQLVLGLAYLELNENEKSSHYFKLAADQGDVDAMYFLGTAYLSGSGVPQNGPIGLRHLTLAGDAGSTAALLALGSMHQTNYSETNSSKEALKAIAYFQKAFLLGDSSAAVMISTIYTHGSVANLYLSSVWTGAFQATRATPLPEDPYRFLPVNQRAQAMIQAKSFYSKFASKTPPKSFLDEIKKYRKPAA